MNYNAFTKKLAVELEKQMGAEYEITLGKEAFKGDEPEDVLKIFSSEYQFTQTCRLEGLYMQCATALIPVEEIVSSLEKAFFSTMLTHLIECHPERIIQTSRIIYRLDNFEKNKERLKNQPHIRYLDFAITFHLVAEYSKKRLLTIPINNHMKDMITLDKDILYKHAQINTPKYLELDIISPASPEYMNELVNEIANECDNPSEDMNEKIKMFKALSLSEDCFRVISNRIQNRGATALLYPDSLKSLSNEWESDLIFTVCSIHEIIAEAYTDKDQLERINSFAKESKGTLIPEDEFLSNHVYLYSRQHDRIEIIA